ncbi:MAG TPA: ATP-binding protein [Gemmataceae bacterium]|jgi:PAS domain S-box-containing protein
MSEPVETVVSPRPVGAGVDPVPADRCPLLPPGRHADRRQLMIDLGAAAASGVCPLAGPLDERVQFETLLADLSAAFVNLPPGDVDGRIDDALRQVVELLGADRGGFGEVSETDWAFRVTHSYAAPGVPPSPPRVLESQLPWYSAMIRRGDVLKLVPIPDALPAEAVAEREYCTGSGLKSQLTIPLKVGGTVQFAIGCASFRESRPWPEELVRRLRLLGEVFANALARKRADEELWRRERRYRELVESTRAVPWEADPDTLRATYVAPQVVPMLGYPHQAWYRDGFWQSRLHPDDRAAVLHGFGEAVRRGRDCDMEYRLVAADGRTVWVRDQVTVPTDGGGAKSLRGVMTDVTERKRAEGEAAHLKEQLARTSRAATLGELAAAIAHEVNQPLCAIVSNGETAQDYLAGGAADLGEVRDALRDIVADGRRAAEIVRRIRALFRTRQPERAPFDLTDAAREVAALLHHRLARDGIALALDLAAGLPPVLGDRVQVQQVVLNLMANAAEAMAGGAAGRRQLSVSTARVGGAVAVSVRDSGPGISPDRLDRVFDAFFTTKPDGTGVGLSISRTIVEAHGGRIWAETAAGGGAAFHVTLPSKEPSP